MIRFVLFFGLLTASDALAFCPVFGSMDREISRCEDNFLLGNQAVACLEQYTQRVKDGQAKIRRTLEAELAKLQSQQNASFDTAYANYQDAQHELERLASEGIQTQLAVDGYMGELFFPEDWDNPSITGQSVSEYLNSSPCFASPKRAIATSSQLIAKMVSDLRQTSLTAGQKKQTSGTSSDKVQVLDRGQQQPLRRTTIDGHVQGGDGNKSGISGTTEPRDKR